MKVDKKYFFVLIATVFLFLCGYTQLIRPIKKRNQFLRELLRRGDEVGRRKAVFAQLKPAYFDNKKEVMRLLSKHGRLQSWKQKKNKQDFSFVWLGEYGDMLRLMKGWPSFLRIKEMHWERGKKGGVYWSGHYKRDS